MKRIFNRNVTYIKGFSVSSDGTVNDFEGKINRSCASIERACTAARKIYKDSTITITELRVEKHKFAVDDVELMKIAEQID